MIDRLKPNRNGSLLLIRNDAMAFTLPHPTNKERDELAKLFASIASEAGVRVMEVYHSDFEHRTKADYSPVSDADEQAEEVILARLAAELPGVPVLAEERAAREEKEKESAAKVARENSLNRVLLESYYYLTRALLEP